MKENIVVYSDGSSRGNPGPGGWGSAILFPNGKVIELGGREDMTTNNKMELTGALMALREIYKREKDGEDSIEVHVDSAYVLQGITMWVYGWEKNGWLTKTGDPVLNQELWKDLAQTVRLLKLKREIKWTKVSGHAGVALNERVDTIATAYATGEKVLLYTTPKDTYMKLVEEEAKNKPKKSAGSSSKKAYSYVSKVDGKVSVDSTWEECKKRVSGKKRASYKKVFSKEEEEEVRKDWN